MTDDELVEAAAEAMRMQLAQQGWFSTADYWQPLARAALEVFRCEQERDEALREAALEIWYWANMTHPDYADLVIANEAAMWQHLGAALYPDARSNP